jgi:5'-3' exonuclease
MGIKDLLNFLRKRNLIEEIDFEEVLLKIQNNKVVIDGTAIFSVLFYSISSIEFSKKEILKKWFIECKKYIEQLNTNCVIIFDGKTPEIKNENIGKIRLLNKEKNVIKYATIKNITKIKEKEPNNFSNNLLNDYQFCIINKIEDIEKIKKETLFSFESEVKNTLCSGIIKDSSIISKFVPLSAIDPIITQPANNTTRRITSKEYIKEIEDSVQKNILQKTFNRTLNLKKDFFDTLIKKLKKGGYNIKISSYEAEKKCASFIKKGIVDYVITTDTDIIVHQAIKGFIFVPSLKKYCYFQYKNIIDKLQLNEKSFLDFCIMSGCDYNSRIKGVGVETSYKNIVQHGSIEKYSEVNNVNISPLNYIQCRKIFGYYINRKSKQTSSLIMLAKSIKRITIKIEKGFALKKVESNCW